MTCTRKRIETAVEYIVHHTDLIEAAHTHLGLPLEDCIAEAARRALLLSTIAPEQLSLQLEAPRVKKPV